MALALARTRRELRGARARTRSPERRARVFAVLAQCVEQQIDLCETIHIAIEVAHYSLQRVERGLFGRHAVTHILHDAVRSARANVLLATPGGPRAADILIEPQSAADDRR